MYKKNCKNYVLINHSGKGVRFYTISGGWSRSSKRAHVFIEKPSHVNNLNKAYPLSLQYHPVHMIWYDI